MATDFADIREELASLGEQRQALDTKDDELTKQIKDALGRASGQVSMKEAADLLKLHRTTLYRVYK
jgi:transcriptional regulator of acetoin/glycerol metabolism